MKVFAEYFEEDGLQYRINTLLQFGDSWELIGNVVLANPGSAKPLSAVDTLYAQLINQFFIKNRNINNVNVNHWFQFIDDETMQRIEKIFNGWYINPEEPLKLNGVIQLFNTFNIKNQYLDKAISSINMDSTLLFAKGIEKYFNDKPTYFGFSQDVLNDERLYPVAKNIFENSSDVIKKMYNNKFDENKFYHPTAVNIFYKRDSFQDYKNDILKTLRSNMIF